MIDSVEASITLLILNPGTELIPIETCVVNETRTKHTKKMERIIVLVTIVLVSSSVDGFLNCNESVEIRIEQNREFFQVNAIAVC